MRYLGLDIGSSRIGVAISDPFGRMAHPIDVIERDSRASEIEKIKGFVLEYEVKEIVVGLPITMGGETGRQAKMVTAYVATLEREVGIPVKLWDERLSTVLVERAMVSSGVKRRKRKKTVDKLAAAVILQGYLDARGIKGPRE
ncbi:MAG: Holliday junction resolvase RuvX [Actinobacteria bacterium]|nr:Holliday junction resolvase RuvX [Actinomycetota bacterium]